ncbi:MAG TPA: GH92 family glycosyl hydrolase, partial [Solirubrobacterales bacterium]|nr:GH92 family glycosyl hydrolase [Solirubrobacterales bacterium]
PRYRVYFAALFDRPFAASGTWAGLGLEPGAVAARDLAAPPSHPNSTAEAGAYVSFDARRRRRVAVRVGVSFTSLAGARANLREELRGDGFGAVAAEAGRRWNAALGRVRISGGTPRRVRTFYTALYHAILAPRTFDDVDGTYLGMDGRVHRARHRTQYADFSGWDVYRTQVPLLAMLYPRRAGDLARSLLADATQSGCLPRWSYAAGQSMTMVGDPAAPALAAAAAFGARFDRRAALAAMVRGASEPCRSDNGEYLERQGLADYLRLGYVPFDSDTNTRNANSLYGSPDAVWGSAATTLEYAIADSAIARLASRLGDRATYRAFASRGANWKRLFNPATRAIEPRFADGSFPDPYDPLSGGGFVEGNSAQYTWLVPQDPAGLFAAMGGRSAAAARLGRFLRALNAGPGGTHTDHALLGNEPTLHTPWLFDWLGMPYRTQEAVRRGLSLYGPTPAGYPGNDDLGTLSAWYVLGALGLYPGVPGSDLLALSSPLFGRAELRLPHHRRAVVSAAGRGIYVQSLRLGGRRHDRPWTTYGALARGADLSFRLGRRPDRRWGRGVPTGTSG